MSRSISQILIDTMEPEAFKKEICSLQGYFSFDLESMISLGETYCRLYPDSVDHADSAQVQIGYRVVRICIVEVIISEVNEALRKSCRELLSNIASINPITEEMISAHGHDEIYQTYVTLDKRVREIKTVIDTMPVGVIKERFVGGISVFYNILYLMKKSISTK